MISISIFCFPGKPMSESLERRPPQELQLEAREIPLTRMVVTTRVVLKRLSEMLDA